MIQHSELKEVYNREEYLSFMDSKRVRTGEDRTYTVLDFISLEEEKELKEKGINDLSFLDPTPQYIKEHSRFIQKTFKELLNKFPNDEFLNSLKNEENFIVLSNTNWYEQYGIKKG